MMRIPSWAAALLFACAVAPAFAADSPPAACDPGGAGAPCGGEQVAGMDNTGGPGQGAGNPVNLITGNKYQRETDMPALPGALGLELVRHYNSSHARDGALPSQLGRGWQLSYETRLYPISKTLHIVQADGARLPFQRAVVGAGLYRHADPARGAVRQIRIEGGDEYLWIWPNGRELRFDRNGCLIRIALPSGEALHLRRTPEGRLLLVEDPQGREMRIHYRSGRESNLIASIDTPVGRVVYEYADAPITTLIAANLPGPHGGKLRRRYHYEDVRFPALLTGIGIDGGAARQERIASWAYDGAGNAVLSVKGEASRIGADGRPVAGTGREQLAFRRASPGLTELTDLHGHITRFRHALINGEFRLLEARGAACPGCGPVNLRYGYDVLGRLTEVTRLDEQGQPQEGRALVLDTLGRLLSLTRIDYAHGRPVRRTLLMRQQFAPEIGPFLWPWEGRARPPFGPVLIAWPSVVPGREHQLRIVYNRRQQPLLLEETGFDPRDRSRIARSIRYRYEDIRGRSRLVEVDGPLPAGAGITRHVWDAAGRYIIRSILPGNAELAFARDEESGRLASVTLRWDDVIRRREFAYSPSGALLRQSDAALDADGRTIAARSTEMTRDERGHPAQIRWPDGGVSELKQDPRGLPMPLSVANGSPYWPHGDESAAQADGVLRAMRGAPGSAAEGIVLRYDANARSAERKLDDFGRVVALRLPEQGWQSARHDAADRIMQITDPRGARSDIVRDAAGRLQSLTRAMADGSLAQELRFAWRGPYRIEEAVLEGGVLRHATRYRHGLFGETEHIEVEIADGDGPPLRMALQSHHDEVGRRISQTLPGGERIVWRHYASKPYRGQRAAVERLRWPGWLDGLMLKLPESWLDGLGLKQRLADMQPEGGEAGADEFASSAASPQPEPGMADAAPGSERDAAGLPHRLRTVKGDFRLVWNAAGMLAEVHAAAADAAAMPVARYSYDARGRRAARHTAARSEYYLYEGTQLVAVAVREAKRAWVRSQYLYAGYRPLIWIRDGQARRLETDHRGAVLGVSTLPATDGKPASLWQSHIDAWGRARPTGEGDPRLRLVNQYADEETGLHYHLARYYDPNSGRFLSPDPSGIADSIDAATPDALKLDISVYASGQPNLYFDPDAAAKLVYYALTTDSRGNALPTKQGFTGARWAFSIEGIQANASTGEEAVDKLIRNYAEKQTGLLYDLGGDYLTDRKKPYATWDGAADETIDAFRKHYDGKMLRLPQFTFTNFSDKDAALLIARVTGNTKELGSCPAAGLLLPEIPFAEEEVPINVTTDAYADPKQGGKKLAEFQRIVQCGEKADEDRRRIKKYHFAAMLMESVPSAINVDCSKNGGCPAYNLRGTALSDYVASYGKTQFIVSTMIETLSAMRSDGYLVSQSTRNLLRLDDSTLWGGASDDSNSLMKNAKSYAIETVKYFNDISSDTPEWNAQDLAKKKAFMAKTGLLETDAKTIWDDMIKWRKNPSANLGAEAAAAFASTVVLKNKTVRTYLMSIFTDSSVDGAFDKVSEFVMWVHYGKLYNVVDDVNEFAENLEDGSKNPKWLARQREIELEFATRVARMHNGDLCKTPSKGCERNVARTGTLKELMEADGSRGGQYATRFVNVPEYPVNQPADPRRQQPVGNYFSLRCADVLPAKIIARAGIQMLPLKI